MTIRRTTQRTTRRTTALLTAALLTAVLGGVSGVNADDHKTKKAQRDFQPLEAVTVLRPTKGNKVTGTIVLSQRGNKVHVTGTVKGLKPGKHGFHIHQFGDVRDAQGKSAGGHFNPENVPHGGPSDKRHHVGDLGNIMADATGTAKVKKVVDDLKLHFVIGRSIVVHGGADDLTSQPSGDAGPRVSVGVIGLAETKGSTHKHKQAAR